MEKGCTEGNRKKAEYVFIREHRSTSMGGHEDQHVLEEPTNPDQLYPCGENEPDFHHPHRKFILSFQNTEGTGSPEEECIMSDARRKCRAFWAFVDTDPVLTGLIRPGVPVLEPQKPDTSGLFYTDLKINI